MTHSKFPGSPGGENPQQGNAGLPDSAAAGQNRQSMDRQAPELPLRMPDIGAADWDALFCAIQTVLARNATRASAEATSALQAQALVLDCLASLDLLHAALAQERDQRAAQAGPFFTGLSGVAPYPVSRGDPVPR